MTSNMRKIVFFLLLVGLAFVAYAFMIKPANEDLEAKREKMAQTSAKLEELERATTVVDDLTMQLAELSEAIKFFESKLPPDSEVDAVLKNVTLIAQKNGLRSKTITALKRKNNNGYVEQPLKMELHGDFNDWYSFLLELERLDRITKIRELTIKKGLDHQGQIQATFVVSIFFQNTVAG